MKRQEWPTEQQTKKLVPPEEEFTFKQFEQETEKMHKEQIQFYVNPPDQEQNVKLDNVEYHYCYFINKENKVFTIYKDHPVFVKSKTIQNMKIDLGGDFVSSLESPLPITGSEFIYNPESIIQNSVEVTQTEGLVRALRFLDIIDKDYNGNTINQFNANDILNFLLTFDAIFVDVWNYYERDINDEIVNENIQKMVKKVIPYLANVFKEYSFTSEDKENNFEKLFLSLEKPIFTSQPYAVGLMKDYLLSMPRTFNYEWWANSKLWNKLANISMKKKWDHEFMLLTDAKHKFPEYYQQKALCFDNTPFIPLLEYDDSKEYLPISLKNSNENHKIFSNQKLLNKIFEKMRINRKAINALTIENFNLTEFPNLQTFTAIRELTVENCGISDISFLKKLKGLVDIYMNNNNIIDITPLAKLSQLDLLQLNNNNITDITPLTNLSKLGHLELNNNNITDIAPLINLIQLAFLRLNNNNIYDLSPLTELDQLEELELDDNNITESDELLNILNKPLEILSLKKNQISDGTIFKEVNINTLYLDNNNIKGTFFIPNNCNKLSLKNNEIAHLKIQKENTKLNTLYLDKNDILIGQIAQILPNLTNLNHISLKDNNITDITPLQEYVVDFEHLKKTRSETGRIIIGAYYGEYPSQTIDLKNNKIKIYTWDYLNRFLQSKTIEIIIDKHQSNFLEFNIPYPEGYPEEQ